MFDDLNSSDQKVITYETRVHCDAGRSIEILDERRDHDNLSTDDFEGSIIYNLRFDSADTVTKSVLAVLPDTDGWGDDNEEMYHSVGFQVTRQRPRRTVDQLGGQRDSDVPPVTLRALPV